MTDKTETKPEVKAPQPAAVAPAAPDQPQLTDDQKKIIAFIKGVVDAMAVMGNMKGGIEVLDTLRKEKRITQRDYNAAMDKVVGVSRVYGLYAVEAPKQAAEPNNKEGEGEGIIVDKNGNKVV